MWKRSAVQSFIVFAGLTPILYAVMLALHVGSGTGFRGIPYDEGFMSRLVPAIAASAGIAILFAFLRFSRGNMHTRTVVDPLAAMKVFARARDKYMQAGLQKEAAECDLLIARVQHIALDPRIDLSRGDL